VTTPVLLSDMFHIRPRFYRSVNLAQDYADPSALKGYIITPLCRSILGRLVDAVQADSRTRAWSITGPYGTGKSACCLFAANVLADPKDPELYGRSFTSRATLARTGLVPILACGNRRPMSLALLEALESAICLVLRSSKRIASLRADVKRLRRRVEMSKLVTAEDITALFTQLATVVASTKRYVGLLIIIDELGKLLEYAALRPTEGDIFLLQALAELSNRSSNQRILLITVLHQAFNRYATSLGVEQQREWAKVQGRFEDIGFIEHSEQLLRLIGAAIQRKDDLDGYAKIIREESVAATSLGIVLRNREEKRFRKIIESCAPVHPITAVILGPLFRGSLAQNERSLFAFLSSGETHGLRHFLSDKNNAWVGDGRRPFYRIDKLYDYVVLNMGNVLMAQSKGKRWAEIANALDRIPKNSAVDEKVIKAIGMLNIHGDGRYIKASHDILQFGLVDGISVYKKDLADSLKRLKKANIITYRHYSGSYTIWEGSDIDLETKFQDAIDKVDRSGELATLLNSYVQVSAYVANRHLHETGTLRYFLPVIADETKVHNVLGRSLEDAAGLIVFVIPRIEDSIGELLDRMIKLSGELSLPLRNQLLFAVPKDIHGLRTAIDEVVAWEWVATNTLGLEGDRVARKELAVRLSNAHQRLDSLCSEHFSKECAYTSCFWVYSGEMVSFKSARELTSKLSDVCDAVFHLAPIIHNELVNRRKLSPAAAAARRALMEHMISEPFAHGLGIQGTPPEMSMYISVLERTGLHHRQGEHWIFRPPKMDRWQIRPLWQGISGLLNTTESDKRSVAELFDELSLPPFGVNRGLLPIFLLAYILHDSSEIAIYEDGTFVPELKAALFERLNKAPERFSIQRYRIAGARKSVFRRLATVVESEGGIDHATLINALRPLYAFVAKLPPYSRSTHRLSPHALAVRKALLNAREPHQLMFERLPDAVGEQPFVASARPSQVEKFFSKLKKALTEQQNAYELLLNSVKSRLTETFCISTNLRKAREELASRAGSVREMVADPKLKALIIHLTNTELEHRQWIESIAACLTDKPPSQWIDSDLARFDLALVSLAKQFQRVEEIAIAQTGVFIQPGSRIVRLGVIDSSGAEYRQIIHIKPTDEAQIHDLADEMEALFKRTSKKALIKVASVAELTKRILNSGQHGSKDVQ